jgi:hypothetical protein
MTSVLDRDFLGYVVRQARRSWAMRHDRPAPAGYDELPEEEKEAERRVGEAVCSLVSAILKDFRRSSRA